MAVCPSRPSAVGATSWRQLAPTGPVYQAGTLSGNPVATAAGLATLRLADQDVYDHIDAVSGHLRTELNGALAREGLPHTIQWAGNLFSTFFGASAAQGVRDYDAVRATESWRYAPFFHSLLDSGVYAPPSPFEAWFVSSAHDDAAVDRIVGALPAAVHAAASATQP